MKRPTTSARPRLRPSSPYLPGRTGNLTPGFSRKPSQNALDLVHQASSSEMAWCSSGATVQAIITAVLTTGYS
ncbi:hypothetical protein CWK15_16080 [Salmonella enterica]|uniref:Uncharacterized protein n=1 Tax=Salmonella enterica TaxID=28901 RepID=A0A5V4Z5J9_SALER|nr:hypothetical protein [Salmonella enterica]ECJ5900373.1 hypothetical protein [Salmonella enterica subsp. diarizonae]ECN6753442.1 hypothetical protein [Salmonella enterica subsp. enterica serovar Newport]EDV1591787.1 hypothetical protein [Salmonella enterica subsp. salamae]EDX3148518.1 hypothetical protein [Salmonella enterica subsp. diarizonae serovar 61:l,v:1,5,7]